MSLMVTWDCPSTSSVKDDWAAISATAPRGLFRPVKGEAPPAMPADGKSAHCKQLGDGLPDRLPRGVGVIGEGGRWVHLEAIPFALRRQSQVDPGQCKTKRRREGAAPVRDKEGDQGGLNHYVFAPARRITIVVSVADDLGREHRAANDMNAVIPSRQVLLELRRAPDEVLEATSMLWLEPADDAAHPADRLVNDLAVAGGERGDLVWIGGDQRVRHREAVGCDDRRLVGLRAVCGH